LLLTRATGDEETAMPIRVLFLCTGNSARSQIAEALLRTIGGNDYAVCSAGTNPRETIAPEAKRVIESLGVDATTMVPKDVAQFEGQQFDFVITLCDRALESCRSRRGANDPIHWSFPNPTMVPDEARAKAFDETATALERRIRLFITVQGAR
jgi:protein-tyrosine-phosphatase